MPPHATELAFASASDHGATAFNGSLGAESGIVSAFLEALNESGTYQLVDRAGELFIEPR